MPTVAFHTLGCKVNQYETDAIAEMFKHRGYRVVGFDEPSDVYVINTCTVTSVGDQKSRQIIRRASAHPGAVVVVTGCYAQTEPHEVAAIPGVDLVVGTQGRGRIVDLVEEQRGAHSQRVTVSELTGVFEDLTVNEFGGRTRAMLKIQEGCRQFCSYCKVPYARGPLRSMPAGRVLERVGQLIGQGYREIVLTGIHLGLYGCEEDGQSRLSGLIARILELPGLTRLRLSSLEPMDVDDALIALFSGRSALCPHLHLPLQSGCDQTLRRMNRPYLTGDFRALAQRLRSVRPDMAISTDLIVGFPGETRQDFEESLAFCREMAFSRMHVFKYSPRKDTPAAVMPGQVPAAEKERRSRATRDAAAEMAGTYHRTFVGRDVEVLCEEGAGGRWTGLTPHYVRAEFRLDGARQNQLYRLHVTGSDARGIRGQAGEPETNL